MWHDLLIVMSSVIGGFVPDRIYCVVVTNDVTEVVNELIESNRTIQRELNEAQSRIHEQSMELESADRRALTDSLTRIANRRSFDMFIADQHSKGFGNVSTLALLDVDHFKKLNDNHGHLAGDEVLRSVAGLLLGRLNQFGHVARYGGKEIAIVFEGVSKNDAKQLLETTRVAISKRETEFENKVLRVTASIGVAQFDREESVEEWIQRADAGLYQSKEAGRNCTHWMNENEPVLVSLAGQASTSTTSLDGSKSSLSALESFALAYPPDEVPIPEVFSGLPDKIEPGESGNGILNRMESDEPMFLMALRNHET